MKPDVLAIGSFPDATMTALNERFTLHQFRRLPLPAGALSQEARGRIRAIATEANQGADRALIDSLPKLEVISVFGVGVDAIDVAAARERNIPVTNTPDILTDDCADLAIGLMLASARQIVKGDAYVREGKWTQGPISFGRPIPEQAGGQGVHLGWPGFPRTLIAIALSRTNTSAIASVSCRQ